MNGIYFCKLFLESTFTFTNWNLNLQLTPKFIWLYLCTKILQANLEKFKICLKDFVC